MKRIVGNIEKVIYGKREVIEMVLMALICKGHVLIEDIPGVGKTTLAHALAKSVECSYNRIQFTPDVMPSDIVGFSIYNPKSGEFDYKEGAIMSNFILGDEINRTSPKTQSSLLEVMEENQVTVDGKTYYVPEPFMVLATQNPVEYIGTYPLPEAQLDRFFMKISLGYPAHGFEMQMLKNIEVIDHVEKLRPVVSKEDILYLQQKAHEVYVHDSIVKFIVDVVSRTRESDTSVILGASPRASICLYKAAQAWAMYSDRDYVIPDDVIKMVKPILEHRIILSQEAVMKKVTAEDIVDKALRCVKIPAYE